MLTHVHYGETLCGWQYRSKSVEKGVESAGHGVTERIRHRDRTRLVFNPRPGQRRCVDRTLGCIRSAATGYVRSALEPLSSVMSGLSKETTQLHVT